MKLHISNLFKEKNIPVLMFLQAIVCTAVITLYLSDRSEREAQIQEAIVCDFFVNISEWRSGHQEYISPDMAAQNEQGALRVYRRVIKEEEGLCEEGMCLDSSRITLFKSCPDDSSVEVLKDTIIYY